MAEMAGIVLMDCFATNPRQQRGFYDVIALNRFGFLIMVIIVGLLLFAFLAFGICKALSELVKNSYLHRKVLEAKLLDEGYELEEIEEEN